ncbi:MULTISPECIES: hypothetical protein [Vibrio]|uniref:hypothetical protein n=1 Tax=Vibrio TaxID=662 RepID=UPI000619F5EE|nr:hypothetical protein FAZ90_08845 [Vibrio cyclitrophicus]
MMMKLKTLLLTSVTSMSLIACGGGGGGSGSSGGGGGASGSTDSAASPAATAANTTFVDIAVPDSFEWRGTASRTMSVIVVSSFSYKDGEPAPIRGSHIIKLYSVTSDQTGSQAFYSGMSNRDGELVSDFSIPTNWEGLEIVAQVRGQECRSTVDLDNVTTDLLVSCDIVLDSD